MLPARAAERVHDIFGDVVAALHRDGLDGVRHVGDGDPDEAVGDLLRRAAVAELPCQRREGLGHGAPVERLVLPGTEDARKERGLKLASHHIGVGHGERPAAPIGERPGIGARGVRSHPEARLVVMQDRAAARRDRMDQHHRCAHACSRDHALEGALIRAVIVADIGGRAAHVEADDLGEAGAVCRLDRADHSACRPGQDRVFAAKQIGRGESARGLHEQEPRTPSP